MGKNFLGCRVRDLLTGIEGIVNQKAELFSGCVQWAIQPKSQDGITTPVGLFSDSDHFEVLADNVLVVKDADITPVRVGDAVVDIVTGITGRATAKYTNINGCVMFTVEYLETVDGSPKLCNELFSATRLTVDDAVAPTAPIHAEGSNPHNGAPPRIASVTRPTTKVG